MDPYEQVKCRTTRYKKVRKILLDVYGYTSFKPTQYEIINNIINKEDVCAILPTGYGKSLTFQLPALYIGKPAIIVSPLISLMADQKFILDKLNITSCCYNSNVKNRRQMRSDILNNKYQFIYITPESLVTMQDFLVSMNEIVGISLIAVDEAHCISSYGFDFRTSYRRLTMFKDCLPDVPILAVTATATKKVAEDICSVLNLKNKNIIRTTFDRPNLYLEFRDKSKKSRIGDDLIPLIKEQLTGSIIIYCISIKDTELVYEIMSQSGIKCGIYHANIKASERESVHEGFISGEIRVVAATIAFGMGINKSDVRLVIHYGCPKTIEGYYQEIGRAGRDGKPAKCITFYGAQDFKIQEFFIDNTKDETYKKHQYKMLEQIKLYAKARQCRRKIILEYFGETVDGDNCGNCDNCNHVHADKPIEIKTYQNIDKEAKLLIGLIYSLSPTQFGITKHINILRGSKSKDTKPQQKSEYFNKGCHKSVEWWKEVAENLIKLGYITQVSIKSKYVAKVLKVTDIGCKWCFHSDLTEILDIGDAPQMEQIEMKNIV